MLCSEPHFYNIFLEEEATSKVMVTFDRIWSDVQAEFQVVAQREPVTLISSGLQRLDVTFSTDYGPYHFFLSYLFQSRSTFPLSHADTSDCPFSISYPLSPHISDRPLHYRVALPLSPYPCGCPYLVRYIGPQSSVTIRLDYVPLPLVALPARSRLQVYKLYYYSTWTLSLSFRAIETSEPDP